MDYMSDKCQGCNYHLKGEDEQECKKWVNSGNASNFESCNSKLIRSKYKDYKPGNKPPLNADQSDFSDCMEVKCPPECQYPFPRDYYNKKALDDNNLYNGWKDNGFDIKSDIFKSKIDDYEKILSKSENINENYYENGKNKKYKIDEWNGIGKKFKCGKNSLLKPDNIDDYGKDIPNELNFPQLPTNLELRDAINNQSLREYTGIDWSKFKKTPLLIERLKKSTENISNLENENYFTISGNEIYYSPYGIDISWWDEGKKDPIKILRNALPESIRSSITNDEINLTTLDITKNIINNEIFFNKLFYNGQMVVEQFRDWAIKRDIKLMTGFDKLDPYLKPKFSLSNLFGIQNITRDSEVEHCFNKLMHTNNYGKSDEDYLKIINTFDHLYDFGKPQYSDELLYIERKIKKFLSLKKEKVNECFSKVYGDDPKICNFGVSSNAIKIITSFLDMESELSDNKEINDYTSFKQIYAKYYK